MSEEEEEEAPHTAPVHYFGTCMQCGKVTNVSYRGVYAMHLCVPPRDANGQAIQRQGREYGEVMGPFDSNVQRRQRRLLASQRLPDDDAELQALFESTERRWLRVDTKLEALRAEINRRKNR